MRHLKTVLAVFGAAAILVLAGNAIAMAATGQPFLLGKTNFAGNVTTIERTNTGPAFKITNDNAASAPFVTNGTGKVTNLNADKFDGLDSSAFTKSIASGYVTSATTPGLVNPHNVSAVVWNDTDNWYEITITGVDFFFNDFVPTVTPTCSTPTPVAYNSVSDKLIVEFAGGVQCGFGFSVQQIGS